MNASPAAMAILMKDDVEKGMWWKYILHINELKFETDPLDADNLTRCASAMMMLALEDMTSYWDVVNTWEDAASKLKEAMEIDPKNHYAIWLLGRAFDGLGLFALEVDTAKAYLDMATQCFRKAVDEDPTNKLFALSLYRSFKAPEEHFQDRQDLILQYCSGREPSIAKAMERDKFANDLEWRLKHEYELKLAETKYESNPDDVDILQRLASSLLELSQYESPSVSLEMLNDAIFKLEKALQVDPNDPYTYWCLGKTHTAIALLTPDLSMAKPIFEMATQCFQKAVNLDPNTGLFTYSLKQSLKAPEKYLLPREDELLPQLTGQGSTTSPWPPQLTSHGSTTSSNIMGAKNVKFGVSWDMIGWMVLSVGIITWFKLTGGKAPP